MRTTVRVAVGTALVLAAVLAMGALTRVPFRASPDQAELRLAWRFRVPRVEHCREPTEEELEQLPVHMRQDEICEGRPVAYQLTVRVNGQLRHRSEVQASGARGDRPLYVFEALPLPPGAHRIQVVFQREDLNGDPDQGAVEAEALPGEAETQTRERARVEAAGEHARGGRRAPVARRLVLDRRLRVEAHDVILVTYDPESGSLEILQAG